MTLMEFRYFFDLVTSLLVGAKAEPRYVQNIAQIHSMMALVRPGLGIALVPEAAATLRFTGVVVRPIKLTKPPSVDLHIVWNATAAIRWFRSCWTWSGS